MFAQSKLLIANKMLQIHVNTTANRCLMSKSNVETQNHKTQPHIVLFFHGTYISNDAAHAAKIIAVKKKRNLLK